MTPVRSESAQGLAAEAAVLLRRLNAITDELGTGFDFAALAESALDALEVRLDADRSAIYAGYEHTRPVQLAVRGADRAPWPDPDEAGSVLHTAWELGRPTASCGDDADGRRIIAHPILNEQEDRIGLMVADRSAARPFTSAEMARLSEVATEYSPLLDAGMLFSWLRTRSGGEDRARLANQIHNGIAQELVALGFQVDSLRLGHPGEDPRLRSQLDVLRSVISRMVADMRVRIAELKIDTRPDGSVGALLVSRLQVVGGYTGLVVRTTLRESGSRLPSNVEALVYRLALDIIADAARSAGATRIDLELEVSPPSVRLRVAHDGPTTGLTAGQFRQHPLAELGTVITYDPPEGRHGPDVTLLHQAVDRRGTHRTTARERQGAATR